MLTIKDLTILAKQVAQAKKAAPIAYSFGDNKYSFAELNDTLRDEFKLLAGTYNDYRRNKVDIFEIMQEVIDEVLPMKIIAKYGDWAEIKQYGQGNKPSFVRRTGNKRAKQFVTKVGLAGIYEVFKLDKEFFEVDTTAFGGAAQIGLEEFLDGVIDFATILDIMIEGLDDSVYVEIAKALATLQGNLPSQNKGGANGFDESIMDGLLTKARSFGTPVIYATLELATKIVPTTNWISDQDRAEMRSQGYVGIYKGTKVIVLPQSFTDETLATKVIDPSFAYILVAGGNQKPVKIALEGETIVDEYVNKDRSREIQSYKKFGVALMATSDMFLYEDTTL